LEAVRIWIVNHYADAPDGQATRTFDLARRMVERGHPTSIFTSSFGHYHFKAVRQIGGLALWRQEFIDGVELIWVRTTPYHNNDWRRLVNMVSFSVVALLCGVVWRPRPNAVIGVSVHPLGALTGWLLAKVRRASYFCEITDLWPQTLIEFGRLRADSVTARMMRYLERFLYQRASRIIMLWRHTDSYVESLGVSPTKITWLPHGVELSRYAALETYTGGVLKPFRLMFLGGFVSGNSIDTILKAAHVLQLRDRHDIRFILVGPGTERPSMIALATRLGLANVVFREPVPKADIAYAMNEADAFIYGVKDLPLYKYGISMNKVTDYLAAGRPIIFFGNSSYDPVATAGAGISVPPGDPEIIADAIERLADMNPEDRVAMGQRGRTYLLQYHNIPLLADKLLACLGAA